MKKQFLILVFLVVAVFASVSNSFGQAIIGSAPRGISCVDDPLHPMAGKEYIYQAASNQAGNYTFWATKDFNFISSTGTAPTQVTTTNMALTKLTTPVGLLTAGANYATAAATDNITITWSDATLFGTNVTTSPTFVVVNKDGLCANNLKIWSIDPIVAFTVDIKNMLHTDQTPLAYEAVESQCMDQVRGATYNAGTLQYDFGTQYLYWEVVAANFTNSYTPTFRISGLGSGQTATIEWDELATFASTHTAGLGAIVNGVSLTSTDPVATSVTNTSTGVSIYVRVIITNHTFEGLALTPVTLAVDGQNSVGNWDIVNNTVAAPTPLTCILALGADQNDAATQTLNPRPTVTSTTVGAVPPYVTPEPFVGTNATN